MSSNQYYFAEHWTIPGATPHEVWSVMIDATTLPLWWRGVYLSSQPLGEYTGPKIGARFKVHARGFLPYSLRFVIECTDMHDDRSVEARVTGDFDGIWKAEVTPTDDGARVDTDWRVTVQKPFIRWFSPLLKPVFAWNHRWTTPRGESGLRAFIAARRRQAH